LSPCLFHLGYHRHTHTHAAHRIARGGNLLSGREELSHHTHRQPTSLLAARGPRIPSRKAQPGTVLSSISSAFYISPVTPTPHATHATMSPLAPHGNLLRVEKAEGVSELRRGAAFIGELCGPLLLASDCDSASLP
jgi:hypothetical protein